MDINVLVVLTSTSLVPIVLMFLGPKRSGWAMIGLFGVAICVVATLALLNDGNLTQVSGGTTSTLAAANGNFVSDFNAVSWMPVGVALTEFVITIRRAFKI